MKQDVYVEQQSEYFEKHPTWHVEDSPWKAKQIKKILEQNNIHFNRIAEIGCGAGEILKQLQAIYKSSTIQFVGYEISPDAFALALSREGDQLTFFNEDLLSKEEYFDVLLMIDVFEHVEDYIGFIKSSNRKANYKVFHIPLEMSVISVLRNMPIEAKQSVGHLHFFMKDTILSILKDTGLEIIDFFYTPGALELPNKPLRTRLLSIPRKILFSINADFAVRLFGGYSLIVLGK
jgi:SAM-dependent methyltransferase